MGLTILAISVGAALGALSRWGLGLALNGLFPAVPPGTLAANLIGGYLVGLALPVLTAHRRHEPEKKFGGFTYDFLQEHLPQGLDKYPSLQV